MDWPDLSSDTSAFDTRKNPQESIVPAGRQECRKRCPLVIGMRLGEVIPAVAVLQEQPGSVDHEGFHGNPLFFSQLLQLPSQFRRDPQFDVHALNRIGAADPG